MIENKKVVALCTSRIHDSINSNFIEILNRKLTEKNCVLFVYNLCSDLSWYGPRLLWHNSVKAGEVAVFDLINPTITDALVIMDEKIKNRPLVEDILKKNKPYNIPTIIVDGKYDGCISIKFDYEEGFEKIVRHVIEEHKVTKPFFMGGFKDNFFSEKRLDIFKKVLKENNIPFNHDTMVGYGNYWFGVAEEVTKEKIIDSGNIPQAIICANDIMAMGVCRSLRDNGFRVPEDIIVTGFDGIEEINMCSPKITSCAFLAEDMAEKITSVIIKCSGGEEVAEDYIVPYSHTIFSESCGCKNNKYKFDSLSYFLQRFYRYNDQEKILCEISSRIQMAKDVNEAMMEWKKSVEYNLICLINKSFLDENCCIGNTPFEKNMTVFCDKNENQTTTYDFPLNQIVPDINKIIYNNRPLIFVVLDYLNVPFGFVCFDLLAEDYNQIPQIIFTLSHAIGGFRNIRYQTRLKERMEQFYMLDSLTGIYTRNGAFNLINNLFGKTIEENLTITAVLIDLDRLKYINDTFGHNDGDNAICLTAQALKNSVPNDAICVRFGGDEMIAFFSGICNPDEIRNKINRKLDNYNSVSDKPYTVSASVGIYSTKNPEELNFEYLVKKADELMYLEKITKKSTKWNNITPPEI